MKDILLGAIIFAAAFLLVACGETGNSNMNTNVRMANMNANANTNAMMANENANVNQNTNRRLTREDYERNKEQYEREAKGSGRKIGTGINDMWLWVKSRYELAAADDLRDSTVDVDVDNGVVTLSGTVATAEQRNKAAEVVKPLDGVKGVKNMLKVAPSGNTNANHGNMNMHRGPNANY